MLLQRRRPGQCGQYIAKVGYERVKSGRYRSGRAAASSQPARGHLLSRRQRMGQAPRLREPEAEVGQ